jgi:hypothetical protein
MHWRWIGAGAVALLVAAPGTSNATFLNGNQLYAFCGGKSNVAQAPCLAYIEGTVDTLDDIRQSLKMPPCLPAGLSGRRIRDVVMRFLTKHPKDRADTASSLALAAVVEAWPACNL